MPLLALLAPLWRANPINPEEMLEWPADYTFQMLSYLALARDIDAQLAKREDIEFG